MSNCYVPSRENNDQGQSSSTVEKLSFRVQPTSIPVFITKLYTILNDNAIQEMVSWSNDGQRFCIYDIPSFSKMVLPQHFKHSNWPSFVRQLNMYGFHKMNDNFSARHGRLICEFHHPLFYQNGWQSLRKIRRNSRRSTSTSIDSTAHQHQHRQHQHPHQDTYQHQSQQQEHQNHNSSQGQNQAHLPHEPSPQYNVRCTTSSSYIPISSLLSSSDQVYDGDTTLDFENQSINDNANLSESSNNEMEYQVARMMVDDDEDEDNTNGNRRKAISNLLDNNANKHVGYVIESNNDSMSINHITTKNRDATSNLSRNDRNNTVATIPINQTRDRHINSSINMDVDDSSSNNNNSNSSNRRHDSASQGDDIESNSNSNSTSSSSSISTNSSSIEDEAEGGSSLFSTETVMILRGQLDQLQTKTTDMNSEMFLLKRYVGQLQQSVMVLLNCLSDMISCSDLQGQQLLNKVRVELTQASPSDKSKIKEMLHISQSHHHHHHHHHHHRDQLGNIKSTTVHHEPSELADIICNNDINSIKQGIRDILRRSKQDSEVAKKNHHMQLHPPPQGDNNDGNTASASHPPLDINNKQQ